MPTPISRREVDFFDSTETPAATQAVDQIESAHHLYAEPEKITAAFQTLGGPDLKHTLDALQSDGKLHDIIDELSPSQRQAIIEQAMHGGLLTRDGLKGLSANTKLPADFQKLVDDFNTMGPQRTKALNYDWSPVDHEQRALETIRDLKPGESAKIDAGGSFMVHHMKYGAGFGVDVQRASDGRYNVGFDAQVGGGSELEKHGARFEGMMNAKVHVEYSYATAEEAVIAAQSVLTTAGSNLAALGKPAAIEGEYNAVAEASYDLGYRHKASLLEVGEGVKVAQTARLELEGEHPSITVKSSIEVEGKADIGLGAEGKKNWAFLNSGIGAGASSRVEIEQRFELGHDAKPPTMKATFKSELKAHDTVLESEISAELEQSDAASFLGRIALANYQEAFTKLGEDVEVEAKQERFELKGQRFGGEGEVAGFGAGAELSVEVKRRVEEKPR